MWTRLRQSLFDRVFGQGAAGVAAGAAISWLVDQIREGRQPQQLDTSTLKPGETYLVTTRPAMSRAEAKVWRARQEIAAQLAKETRPNGRVLRTATRLSKAQARAERLPQGSSRQSRAERMAAELGDRFDSLTSPSRKQVQLEEAAATLDARLDAFRREATRTARKGGKRHVPRTRVFG